MKQTRPHPIADLARVRARARLPTAAALVVTVALAAAGAGQAFGRDPSKPLRLRVNAAIGEAGGPVALVLQTYASRPISQGQLCYSIEGGSVGEPLVGLDSVLVFSGAGDAVGTATLSNTATGQRILVQFSSPSGTINALEGPLVAVTSLLQNVLQPEDVFRVTINEAATMLFDAGGAPVPLKFRDGMITVRPPDGPFRVELEGDKVEPGEIARLSVQTFEPFAIASGQVALLFDPDRLTGTPIVELDQRHGNSMVTAVDTTVPGLLVVSFVSANASMNLVPGEIVSVDIGTSPSAPVGVESDVSFDASRTFFLGPDGVELPLDLRPDTVEF